MIVETKVFAYCTGVGDIDNISFGTRFYLTLKGSMFLYVTGTYKVIKYEKPKGLFGFMRELVKVEYTKPFEGWIHEDYIRFEDRFYYDCAGGSNANN